MTDAEAAIYPSFDLNSYHESHVNYSSMDSSPYGEVVMKELVDSGYVVKVSVKDGLYNFLGGNRPALCKLALTTTETNGPT